MAAVFCVLYSINSGFICVFSAIRSTVIRQQPSSILSDRRIAPHSGFGSGCVLPVRLRQRTGADACGALVSVGRSRHNEEDKMRKLRLLLYAGTMAFALTGVGNALEFPPSDGSTPTGPLQNPAGVGMVTNTSGFQEIGSPYTQAEGQQYTPGTSSPGASPFSSPAPGTAVFRINMQAVAALQAAWWSGQNGGGTGTANKQDPYGVIGWMRIDMAVDGMSKAGFRYGGFLEVRQNALGQQSTSVV